MFDLLGIKKSVGALSEQLRGRRNKIEELKRQREDVATAPAALEDVRAAYVAAVEERRASFRAGLASTVDSLRARPDLLAQPGRVRRGALLFLASENYSSPEPAALVENGVMALFSEQVIQALSSELEALDWSGAGLPMVKREKKLAELDAEIAKLELEFSGLLAEARSAGIVIDVG